MDATETIKSILDLLNKLPIGHQLLKHENKQWCISELTLNRFGCYEVIPITPFCESPIEALIVFFIIDPTT